MKKSIRIDFVNFWGGFDKTDNYFYNLLKEDYDVHISDNPDYLFFSVFGNDHQRYSCQKIFYVGENIAPPLGYCQWSFSFDYLDDPRNYRLPHYLLYSDYYTLTNEKIVNPSLCNRKFCNFVASNPNSTKRNTFVENLSKYKKIDCGGRWMNNIGYLVDDKVKFQSEYKFSIAFENGAYRPEHPGYSTEKLPQSMAANSIPLYWGNPVIGREFNTKSFVNYHDFVNEKDMIDFIVDLDSNDEKYLSMMKEPWLVDNKIIEENKIENIKLFLKKIFG